MQHISKTTTVLSLADGEPSQPLLKKPAYFPIERVGGTGNHLFQDPQGNKSGLRKPKKKIRKESQRQSLWSVSTKPLIHFIFDQTNRKRWGVRLVDGKQHLPHKAFLSVAPSLEGWETKHKETSFHNLLRSIFSCQLPNQ